MHSTLQHLFRTLVAMLAMLAMLAMPVSAENSIYLGPANSGAASGGANWLTGANGGGITVLDRDDAPVQGFDFVISNSVAGPTNNADWRCPPFSLGPAAGGGRPITFTFAYKLVAAVAKGNNVLVQLRFFDASGTNFISEIVLPVGAHTGDASMDQYRTRTIENIIAPPRARTADIWVDANIFEPWVSGTARFGDFSVTTEPRSLRFKAAVIMTGGAGLCAIVLAGIFWRRRALSRP